MRQSLLYFISLLYVCHTVAATDRQETALWKAVYENNIEQAEQLLLAGADVNQQNAYTNTPLMHAVFEGNEHMARLLLTHGANLNYQDKHGNTAFIKAITFKQLPLIPLLLRYEPDKTMQNKVGKTAIDYAYEEHYDAPSREIITYYIPTLRDLTITRVQQYIANGSIHKETATLPPLFFQLLDIKITLADTTP